MPENVSRCPESAFAWLTRQRRASDCRGQRPFVTAGHLPLNIRAFIKRRHDHEIRGEHRYRVVSTKIVDLADRAVSDPTETETPTLVACYPFYFVGPRQKGSSFEPNGCCDTVARSRAVNCAARYLTRALPSMPWQEAGPIHFLSGQITGQMGTVPAHHEAGHRILYCQFSNHALDVLGEPPGNRPHSLTTQSGKV